MRRSYSIGCSIIAVLYLLGSGLHAVRAEQAETDAKTPVVAAGSEAAEPDPLARIQFCDTYTTSKYIATPFPVKATPWKESGRSAVMKHLSSIQENEPGLLRRATAYRPVRIYLIDATVGAGAFPSAAAVTPTNQLWLISAFQQHDDIKQEKILLQVLHEIVHLAEPFERVSKSSEWLEFVQPRIDQVKRRLEADEVSMIEAYKKGRYTDLAIKNGFPSFYATTNPTEALAEITARTITGKDSLGKPYSPPQELRELIQRSLLAEDFKKDKATQDVHDGLTALENGNLDESRRAFDKALKKDPGFGRAYEFRGMTWWFKKEFGKAAADYTEAIERTGSMNAFYARAKVHEQMGNYKQASADYTEVIASQPGNAIPYFWRGRMHMKMKDDRQAESDLAVAARRSPKNSTYRYWYGRVLSDLKKHKLAIAEFDALRELAPKFEAAYLMSADNKVHLEDDQGAISDYTALLGIAPKNASAYKSRAAAYARSGQTDKAIADYEQVKLLEPAKSAFWDTVIKNVKNKVEEGERDSTKLE